MVFQHFPHTPHRIPLPAPPLTSTIIFIHIMSSQRIPSLHQSRRITWGNPYSASDDDDDDDDDRPPPSPLVDPQDQDDAPVASPTSGADADMESTINPHA